MELKNLQDFDFSAAEARIKELQTYKTALSYEISTNQQQADELRNRLKFLEEKIEEHKRLKADVLKEVEDKLSEAESIKSSIRQLRIQYEIEKNDSERLKTVIDAERSTLNLEMASFRERSELREENLAKKEVELSKREKEIDYKFKEVEERLKVVHDRELRVTTQEENLNQKSSEVELNHKNSEIMKNDAKRIFDEAMAQKANVDEKAKTITQHLEDIVQREKILKKDNNDLDEQRKVLKRQQRETEIEMNRLAAIRQRLLKEISNSSIESQIKTEIKEEVDTKDPQIGGEE